MVAGFGRGSLFSGTEFSDAAGVGAATRAAAFGFSGSIMVRAHQRHEPDPAECRIIVREIAGLAV